MAFLGQVFSGEETISYLPGQQRNSRRNLNTCTLVLFTRRVGSSMQRGDLGSIAPGKIWWQKLLRLFLAEYTEEKYAAESHAEI